MLSYFHVLKMIMLFVGDYPVIPTTPNIIWLKSWIYGIKEKIEYIGCHSSIFDMCLRIGQTNGYGCYIEFNSAKKSEIGSIKKYQNRIILCKSYSKRKKNSSLRQWFSCFIFIKFISVLRLAFQLCVWNFLVELSTIFSDKILSKWFRFSKVLQRYLNN